MTGQPKLEACLFSYVSSYSLTNCRSSLEQLSCYGYEDKARQYLEELKTRTKWWDMESLYEIFPDLTNILSADSTIRTVPTRSLCRPLDPS